MNVSMRPAILGQAISGQRETLMQRVIFCRAYYANNIRICLRKKKSKQSYVWIDTMFEAQNICFGSEIGGLWLPIISAL